MLFHLVSNPQTCNPMMKTKKNSNGEVSESSWSYITCLFLSPILCFANINGMKSKTN